MNKNKKLKNTKKNYHEAKKLNKNASEILS